MPILTPCVFLLLLQRKKTLLVEYQQRGKVNQFIDKRFGESNPQMSLEEKMVTRFAEERKLRATSGSNHFNLDDDEDGGELTHLGQSLSTMEEFDNIGLDIDEEEEGLSLFSLFPWLLVFLVSFVLVLALLLCCSPVLNPTHTLSFSD